MKKMMALFLALVMLMSMAACGGNDPNAGVYNAVSCVALGTGMLLDDLSSRQEGTLNLARERRKRL